MKILIADDHAVVRQGLKQILADEFRRATFGEATNAQETIDTIVRMAIDPEDEVSVGTAGKVSTFLHHLMPGIVESMMANRTHKAEFEKSPTAPPKSGSLREPEQEGQEVTGGWKP